MLHIKESSVEKVAFLCKTVVYENLSPSLLMKFSLKTTRLNLINISPPKPTNKDFKYQKKIMLIKCTGDQLYLKIQKETFSCLKYLFPAWNISCLFKFVFYFTSVSQLLTTVLTVSLLKKL